MVRNDFQLIEKDFDEDEVAGMSKFKFKNYVKSNIEKAALKFLESQKKKHTKIKKIKFSNLETQPYIQYEKLSNDGICTHFALRSEMLKVKKNFPQAI